MKSLSRVWAGAQRSPIAKRFKKAVWEQAAQPIAIQTSKITGLRPRLSARGTRSAGARGMRGEFRFSPLHPSGRPYPPANDQGLRPLDPELN